MPQHDDSRSFSAWITSVAIVTSIEMAIFFASLTFYHICIFKKELSKQIERIRLQEEKLERIAKGEPEPDELSPTQKSSLLEAEPTQKSEKEEPKQKKKPVKKTKSAEKKEKKEKEKKEKKEKKKENKKKTVRKTSNLRLSLEDTQRDDYDTGPPGGAHIPPFNPLLSPPTQDSYYDNASVRKSKSPIKVGSDRENSRTSSPLNEKSVYSPRLNKTQEKSLEQVDDADLRTARDVFWNETIPKEKNGKEMNLY